MKDNEDLVRIIVTVPDELALKLYYLKMVVVHLSNNFGCPMFRKSGQFLIEID